MNGLPEAPTHFSGSVEHNGDEFGNEFAKQVLGDIIFGYALSNKIMGYPHVCRKNLCNFRLVSNYWKKAVSTFLEAKKEALYVVKMTKDNSLTGVPEVQENGKILDKFVLFLNSREDPDSYAGFCLDMRVEAFRLENHDILLKFLKICGQDMVEMHLNVPRNGGSFPGQFPNTLQLNAVKKLTMFIKSTELANLLESELLPDPSMNVMTMIQTLLQQMSTLKHLRIDDEWIPPKFQHIKVPHSLVTLAIRNSTNSRLLECLLENHLPDLKQLLLRFEEDDEFPEETLLFQVLDKFRHNLRVLRLFDSIQEDDIFKVRFPVMENLQTLCLMGFHYELNSEMPALSTLFPKLTDVKFWEIDETLVMRFTNPIPSVTTCELSLLVDEFPIPLDVMRGFHSAFPNVTDLTIRLVGQEFPDLQYVFREMRQLKRLSILVDYDPENTPTPDHLDAVLVGAPLEFVKGLKACPRQFLDDIDLDIKSAHSIKMLKELIYLGMCGYPSGAFPGPLITDLAFIYALNPMTKLKHVKLEGHILVSNETVEDWEKEGRKIECIAK